MNIFDKIFEAYELAKLENNIETLKKRDVFFEIDWEEKIVGLYGLRGVGKTTILFQRLNQVDDKIYLSMDWGFLKRFSLFELVKELYKFKGIKNFFIDEINFCETWIEDLKNIYDLLPVKLVFSGSSKVGLFDKGADLSRRVIFFKIPIFSLREYLNFSYGYNFKKLQFEDIFDSKNYSYIISKFSLNHLKDYYKKGQLGIYYQNRKNYELKLMQIIKKMIYEDGALFGSLAKVVDLEKLVYFVANTVQNKISFNALGRKLSLHPKTVENYLNLLEKVGIFYNIKKYGNVTDSIRKEIKPYFTATNFIYSFCGECESSDIIGKVRENFFVDSLVDFLNESSDIFFKTTTDFVVNYKGKSYEFEVGGKNKKLREGVFIVKDDILIGEKNVIPLWVFGFLT